MDGCRVAGYGGAGAPAFRGHSNEHLTSGHGTHYSIAEFACHLTAKAGFTKQATCCTGH
jgi:hypothetical protein